MTVPPVSSGAPDPLAFGLRTTADNRERRTADRSFCTPEDIVKLRAVEQNPPEWLRLHRAQHECHAFGLDGACLDCGSAS